MNSKYPNLEKIEEDFRSSAMDILGLKKDSFMIFDVDVFPQVWPSTALGFGGIGGQAMTKAYTTVISDYCERVFGVYFGEELAYVVKDPTDEFFNDLKFRSMKSVMKSGVYSQQEIKK